MTNTTTLAQIAQHVNPPNDPPLRLVVRVSTSTYFTQRGVSHRKDIAVLRRKSTLHLSDVFDEADEMLRIVNLDKCDDGVYELTWCNGVRDWETGYYEDWDYKLIPYEEPGEPCPEP